MGVQYQDWLGKRNKEGSDGDPSKYMESKGGAYYMICRIGRY
jgi:hypothetical protein